MMSNGHEAEGVGSRSAGEAARSEARDNDDRVYRSTLRRRLTREPRASSPADQAGRPEPQYSFGEGRARTQQSRRTAQ